jgi:accessory gene regulator B
MIDKICLFLTKKIQNEMSDVDTERAEVINYGLHLIIGELPKTFIVLLVAYLLKVFIPTLIMIVVLLPYRAFSGGFHLKTHIGCIVSTTLYYCGIPKISNYFVLYNPMKLIFILCVWIFGMIMITKYAPADTENVPILRKKERKQKRILSYISFTLGLIAALFISNNQIANIILLGNLMQTLMITSFAYKLTNNKYGHELYEKGESLC